MTQIQIKRVYEEPEKSDGFRVFVDRLWPRGMKKEAFHYDLWEKEITPSTELREWFHQNPDENWKNFVGLYQKELSHSKSVNEFLQLIKDKPMVTLLYASKDTQHNHAEILKEFLEKKLK